MKLVRADVDDLLSACSFMPEDRLNVDLFACHKSDHGGPIASSGPILGGEIGVLLGPVCSGASSLRWMPEMDEVVPSSPGWTGESFEGVTP